MNNDIKFKIIFDLDVSSREQLFDYIDQIALDEKIISKKNILSNSFIEREKLDSTAFDDEFAIPHARDENILETSIIFVRFKKSIIWDKNENKKVKCAIMLIVQRNSNNEYLDILSNVATKLMNEDIRKLLKKSKNNDEIIDLLLSKKEEHFKKEIENTINIVGISACATGVAHTYMARDAIISAAMKLNWNAYVETQGQKGPEFILTQDQIDSADAVILATDISVETDRFVGKKVYKVGTKQLINNPEEHIKNAISKGQIMTSSNSSDAFTTKGQKMWIQHIMSGISFMIPFIVFAGIIFAIVTGIGKIIYGPWLDYSGTWDQKLKIYTQANIQVNSNWDMTYLSKTGDSYIATVHGYSIAIFYFINKFAGIGFTVMIPIMGAYIANSIAGRAAIAPAFILTWAGVNPDYWLKWGAFANMSDNYPSNGGGIFAALLFGFVVGYVVKWINTKWKINKYIQPIMPIIIIPVFVTLILGIVTIFILGNIFGILIGYLNIGLQKLEATSVGIAFLGLVLGLLAGVDMGGPINKVASFGATALIFTDGGKAMGTAAAAFAVAPLGVGIATFIFPKKFRDDKPLAINAIILGFMGISEGAIPFAVKYTWRVIIANIIGSGVAGMCAGLFHVSGWVGAWGGPIIALFGGVTTWGMSYIGILWYLLAIAIGVAVQISVFRLLVGIKPKYKKVIA